MNEKKFIIFQIAIKSFKFILIILTKEYLYFL